MKNKIVAALLLAVALSPTLAYAQPFKIPTTACEIAAFFGIVNVQSCEGPPTE